MSRTHPPPNAFKARTRLGVAAGAAIFVVSTAVAAVEVRPLVSAINAVGPKGAAHPAAVTALRQLGQAGAAQIPEILAGMGGASRLSANWLRGAVEAIAQRELDRGGTLPQAGLEAFLSDTTHLPQARSLAYDLILRVDPDAKHRWLPRLLQDLGMELRREGVAFALTEARKRLDAGQTVAAIEAYHRTLSAARDVDQINEAAKRLRELGETVDGAAHFGFLLHWQLIGPLENTKDSGYDVAYGPERDAEPAAEYAGKTGAVKWIDHTTNDQYGLVDLNAVLGKHKGAIAYARAEFLASEAREVEFRIGCQTGHKIWLNGEFVTANHVYHTGMYIDQYAELWRLAECAASIASSVFSDGCLLVPMRGLTALRLSDESGAPEIIWDANRLRPGASGPLIHDGRVYVLSNATVRCGDARTGELLWAVRLKGTYWPTPVLAGDHLYCVNQDGDMQVVKLGDTQGEVVAENRFGEAMHASPAVAGNAMYVRSDRHLWKIAK